jgi:hypothetical protein
LQIFVQYEGEAVKAGPQKSDQIGDMLIDKRRPEDQQRANRADSAGDPA